MKRWQMFALAACLALLGTNYLYSQSKISMWAPNLNGPTPGQIQILPVQGNVWVLIGAGGNITVQAGEDGILLVDTGTAPMSDKVLAAIETISKRTLRYIVDTTDSDDHTGGNSKIAATGEIIPFDLGDAAKVQNSFDTHRASVISYLSVYDRMTGGGGKSPAQPEGDWPDNTYSSPEKRLYFNGEAVVIMHVPANTDGNSAVFFRKSDVIASGDLFDLTEYPLIDLKAGGSIQAILESLNRLLEVAVPSKFEQGGTLVIPGHGRIATFADVVYYRNMVSVIRDRIQDMIKRGLTPEQVKAARPTLDYDARYGNPGGKWTTDKFIEAAYQNLKSGTQAGKN
jgi:glyoxylase-like metal-dependent hydrolase (beta-lactamase superfamily II)